MEYKQFIETVCNVVKESLGKDIEVNLRNVRKNNNVRLESITITEKDSNISPTIYLETYYKEYVSGKQLEDIVCEILKMYKESKVPEKIDIDFFTDYQKVKERIFCKLINKGKNQELLIEVPSRDFLDLSLIGYYSYENDSIGHGTITIQKSHIEKWGISDEEFMNNAIENTQNILGYEWRNIQDIIKDILRENMKEKVMLHTAGESMSCSEEWIEQVVDQMVADIEEQYNSSPMYVLTNCNKFLGAVSMIFPEVLEELGEILNEDYYILPSSIHEVILVPGLEIKEKERLKKLVNEVNVSQVEPEEILSDSVYFYTRSQKKLILL